MKRLLVWFVRQRKAANRLPALALKWIGRKPCCFSAKTPRQVWDAAWARGKGLKNWKMDC